MTTISSSPRSQSQEHDVDFRTAVVGGGIGRRLVVHSLALVAVLLLLFPFVVSDMMWSADIGARLYQAQHLVETGSWMVPHPLPRADPEEIFFPFHLSRKTELPFQYLVFPKHPLLVWMTAGVYRSAGLPGLVLMQTLSTAAAALGTARIVARSRPSLAAASLWFTGLLSPLFFNAYLAFTHSLAAACLIWAAFLALQFVDPRPTGSRPNGALLVIAGLLVAIACFTRTEGALAGIAMAGGFFVTGLGRWSRARWLAALVCIGGASVAAVALDRMMIPANTGGIDGAGEGDWGGLAGRFEGFWHTWLSPGRTEADLIILIIAVVVVAAGVSASQRLMKPAVVALLIAVVLAVARVLSGQQMVVSGLAAACPLLIVGLIRGIPLARRNSESLLGGVTFGLYSLAVLATQYRFGGGAEWGGRYFAAGLPFAIVVAMPGLSRALEPFKQVQARRLTVLAVASGLIINLGGLQSLAVSRSIGESLVDEIAVSMEEVRQLNLEDAESSSMPVDHNTVKPIVVSTAKPVARWSWDIVDDGRWLLVRPEKLETLAARMDELEVTRFILFTPDAEEDLARIRSYYTPESWVRSEFAPGDVVIVSRADQ